VSREGVQKLIGLAVTDVAFRERLLDDPAAAASEYGVDLTDQEIENIRKVHPADINAFADAFVARFGDRAAY